MFIAMLNVKKYHDKLLNTLSVVNGDSKLLFNSG